MRLERHRRRRGLLLALVLLFSCHLLLAQDRSQICVLAFDDRDASGAREPGEMAITRGIGASLLSDRRVTIQSKLLEDSPFASDGLLCFDGLLAGTYQVILTSSEYLPAGAKIFIAAAEPGLAPARIDYGLKLSDAAAGPARDTAGPVIDRAAAEGLMLALAASAVTALLMGGMGLAVYWLVMRPRLKNRSPRLYPAAGGAAAQRRDTNQGSPFLFAEGESDGF